MKVNNDNIFDLIEVASEDEWYRKLAFDIHSGGVEETEELFTRFT